NARLQVFRNEVRVAPVTLGPLAVQGEGSGQRALVEWHASDDRDVQLLAERKQLVFGRLVENVVDDLDGVHQPRAQRLENVPRLPTVHAYADAADHALAA